MAQIPTFDQWMKDTASRLHARSPFLKEVDNAIRAYGLSRSQANRDKIKTALDRWRFEQSKQGKDWKKSVRNEKGAVTNLYRALTDLDKRQLSPEELEAMKYISRMQAMALARQFDGTQLQFKSSTLVGMASGVGSTWQRFKTGASSVVSGAKTGRSVAKGVQNIQKGASLLHQGGKAAVAQAAQTDMSGTMETIREKIIEFCRNLCPDIDPNHVFTALHLGSVDTFATELAPFVGVISSGGKAVVGWIGVAKKAWDQDKMEGRRYAIAPGDPEAAFDALMVLLDRELIAATAQAGVRTVAFTGKALGVFADYGAVTGPVVGLLEVLATIFQTIVEYVRDYRECRAANQMLKLGALNFDIFETSPILGCYFLVVQDHSTIINFAVGEYGTPNWMFDVEQLIRKINPVLSKSRSLIHASRLEIPGAQNMKGIVEQNYSVKTGFDRVTGLPGAIKDKISGTIDAWFDKPEKPPAVDKSRIVGFGSTP